MHLMPGPNSPWERKGWFWELSVFPNVGIEEMTGYC